MFQLHTERTGDENSGVELDRSAGKVVITEV